MAVSSPHRAKAPDPRGIECSAIVSPLPDGPHEERRRAFRFVPNPTQGPQGVSRRRRQRFRSRWRLWGTSLFFSLAMPLGWRPEASETAALIAQVGTAGERENRGVREGGNSGPPFGKIGSVRSVISMPMLAGMEAACQKSTTSSGPRFQKFHFAGAPFHYRDSCCSLRSTFFIA